MRRILATYDLATIYLGDHLGLYTALHESGSMTAAQLAAHTGTHERFTPHNTDERLFYGWSVLFCLPTGMAETPSAGTGAVMRPDTLQRYAAQAGFREVEVLPIAHDLWRFYRLYP